MMNKYFSPALPAIGGAFVLSTSAAFAGGMTPISGSGWNQDMIYEATSPASASAVTYSWDVPGNAAGGGWDFQQTGQGGGGGFASNSFTSMMSNSGGNTQFQLQSFTGNNAMLPTTNGLTFTFDSAGHYSQLALLAAAGYGSRTENVTVNYTDGSTSTSSVHIDDWYVGSGNADTAILATRGYQDTSGNWNSQGSFGMAEIDLAVDQSRSISSLTFGADGGAGYFAYFGVSGAQAAPEPSALIALALGGLAIIKRRR